MYFSAYRQKIQCFFSDSKQILDQNNLVGSGDYRSHRMKKIQKNSNISHSILEEVKFQLKFSKICIFELFQYGS